MAPTGRLVPSPRLGEENTVKVFLFFPKVFHSSLISPRSKISFLAGTLPRSHAQFSRGSARLLNATHPLPRDHRSFPQLPSPHPPPALAPPRSLPAPPPALL